MEHLLQGKGRTNSCMYLALDALLGDRWSAEGRQFCIDIINEFGGYPSSYNSIIPEFAPVKVWNDSFSIWYSQPNKYVEIYRGGWKYQVSRDTPCCFCYVYEDDFGNDHAHATCISAKAIVEYKVKSGLAVIFRHDTYFIKTRI